MINNIEEITKEEKAVQVYAECMGSIKSRKKLQHKLVWNMKCLEFMKRMHVDNEYVWNYNEGKEKSDLHRIHG